AMTCPLITKSDGAKFGKTEEGNIWLDPQKTSPYKFYQFWLNTSDDDAEKYIKIFTLFTKEEIDKFTLEHKKAPHLRLLQKKLAKSITTMVHTPEDCITAIEASQILFGQGTSKQLKKLDENTFMTIFEGVPQYNVSKTSFTEGIEIMKLLTETSSIFPSKGELRRTIQGNGLSINKEKVADPELIIYENYLIGDKYLLVQKGKKNYFLIIAG
ncbi:MAG: tyrosine--tRNA ligase, partial [Bacteroidales bacterium]|nr:tyrosine--tRNA ligase [Bacteroidales bacterium]